MAEGNAPLRWTEDQWKRVQQVVYQEARGARVAGNILPLYGPLGPDALYVSKELLQDPASRNSADRRDPGFTVDDTQTLVLSTLQTKVYLRDTQVADPALTSALIAFRRAANVLARLEDDIIFNGQAGDSEGPPGGRGLPKGSEPPWEVRGGQKNPGLTDAPGANESFRLSATAGLGDLGEELVSAISGAVGDLESRYHLGPFACVLDQEYFNAVQTPNGSLVLPQDRILPFLGGGGLVRSSTLAKRSGILIAMGGAPVDLVIGTDIAVEFLQVTSDPQYVFRVFERLVLRVKDASAIHVIRAGDRS